MKSVLLGMMMLLFGSPLKVFAAKPKCETVKRLLLGPNGRRAMAFSADAGRADVILYWGKKISDLKIAPVQECSFGAVKLHTSLDDLPINTIGYEVYVLDEGSSYRVIVRWTVLRPESKEGVVHEGTTDSERVKKD